MNPRLLVVDDENDLRNTLSEFLELEDYKVFQASDGDEGLEIYKNEKIDVVISDIKMPRKSGIELLEDLKKLDPNSKVLLISGYTEISRDDLIKKGALGFLDKPIDFEEMLGLLRSNLGPAD